MSVNERWPGSRVTPIKFLWFSGMFVQEASNGPTIDERKISIMMERSSGLLRQTDIWIDYRNNRVVAGTAFVTVAWLHTYVCSIW